MTRSTPPATTSTIPGPVLEQLEGHGLRVAGILERVEERLRTQVESPHRFVDGAASYLIEAGGKRFRPLLVALAGHLGEPGGAEGRARIADAGVVVELVHLATLYHDDVIDEAAVRRGARSANRRWGNTVAILTGDYLFARASELSADLGVEVTRIMARTIATLCEGQIREVRGSRGALPPDVPALVPDRDHYLGVVGDKTASLIATSCRLGALLAGCPPAEVEAAARYGFHLGVAFQLSDDVIDITSEHDESGKLPGTDLREGVRTLPVLYALEADPGGELARLLEDGELTDEEVERALALLKEHAALARTREVAAGYAREAVSHLAGFGDGAAVKALTRLAEFTVERGG